MRTLLLLVGVLVAGCASTTERLKLPPLTSVAQVDVNRYLGTWYEIASFPQSFQKDCTGTTANYTALDDGDLRVENRCRKKSLDGPEDVAVGRARVVDKVTNSRLEVSFFRPFWGAYWIIDLAEDYSYAVVGHPGRDYLWILSRTPTLPDDVYQGILARLEAKAYPLDRLNRTAQPATPR
jgi:apolipoprotein D and lipocalin family protein